MTGGGDLDEIAHEDLLDVADDELLGEVEDDEMDDAGAAGDGDLESPVGGGVALNENDPDPTAGASDIGGLPGGVDEDDTRGDDQHEVGGGHDGMGKGPTGS